MNADHARLSQQHFDTAFAAPDGIKKLREFILTLAMQGKLVPQDPNDPPASQLLKEIEVEKKRLVKVGETKEAKPLTDIKIDEMPYVLPRMWAWARLGNITDIIRGITFPASEKTKEPAGGRVGCLRTANVQKQIEWDDLLYINKSFVKKQSQYIRKHDIVMSMANSRELVGKVAIIREHPDSETTFGGFLGVIRTHKVLPFFVLNLLITNYARRSLIDSASQTTNIANVSLSKLNPFLIPLPPLAEQHRIVAKIDQLMVRCDELEKLRAERDQKRRSVHTAALTALLDAQSDHTFAGAWQFIIQHFGELYSERENVAELRKAILQLAVTGKLVPQSLQSTKWEKRRLKELTTKIGSGSTPSGGKESYQDSGVPLIRSMNVHFGGFVWTGLAFLNDAQAEKLKNVAVKTNDVLLNITGASIGRVALAPAEMDGARVNQHVCIIRPTAEVASRFLESFLASPMVQKLINEIQVGATREALTKSMIEQFEISLPSLAEQDCIVAKIDQLMALCDGLEKQIDTATHKQNAILDALMAQA